MTTTTKEQANCTGAQRPVNVISGTADAPPYGACANCGKPVVFTLSLWRHVTKADVEARIRDILR